MLNKKLIPTPLIYPSERKKLTIDERKIASGYLFRLIYIIFCLLKLFSTLLWIKIAKKSDQVLIGQAICLTFLNMGVLWIKIGQLMSLRVDLLSPEICNELSELQYQASGFSTDVARAIIEEEIGAPIERYFSAFFEHPFAAASISQVHRAFLRDEKVWVAIKVRKPDTDRIFGFDMTIIRGTIWLLQWFSFKPYMRWGDMLWEIEQVLSEELDYRHEAANMRRMRKVLRPHKVYVPKIYVRYCGKSLLTMEYISGVLMSDYIKVSQSDPKRLKEWLAKNNVKPNKVGEKLFHSILRQFFEDNLFHADLHPGNIVLLRDSSIAFIDFGSIGFMDRDFLEKYEVYIEALVKKEYSKVFDIYMLLPDNIPSINLGRLKEEFMHPLQQWQERCSIRGLSYDEKSTNTVNDEFLRLLGKYKITMTWAFLRFTRASITLDSALRQLLPHEDINKLIEKYFRQRGKRQFKMMRKGSKSQVKSSIFNLQTILELPIRINESMIFRGTIVRRLAQVFDGITSKTNEWFDGLLKFWLVVLRLASLVILGVFLHQQGILLTSMIDARLEALGESVPQLDTQLWILIAIIIIYCDRVLANLKARFGEI